MIELLQDLVDHPLTPLVATIAIPFLLLIAFEIRRRRRRADEGARARNRNATFCAHGLPFYRTCHECAVDFEREALAERDQADPVDQVLAGEIAHTEARGPRGRLARKIRRMMALHVAPILGSLVRGPAGAVGAAIAGAAEAAAEDLDQENSLPSPQKEGRAGASLHLDPASLNQAFLERGAAPSARTATAPLPPARTVPVQATRFVIRRKAE